MEPHALFSCRDVLIEDVGFLSSFCMLGAVGFRFGVLRNDLESPPPRGASPASATFGQLARSAARMGLLGVGLAVVALAGALLKRAEAKHQSLGDTLISGGAPAIAQIVLLGVLIVGFALVLLGIRAGWTVAVVGASAYALRNILSGRLAGLVNPLHLVGASLWLGTLLVLVVAGLSPMRRSSLPPEERERIVAEMVHRFSPLGLGGSALLGVTGLITAWNHLNPLSSLWTTPYGEVLIVKLAVVGVVVGLGAWNWRRVGPTLGTEGGTSKIRRTASTELAFAGVVLVLTGILVSVPSPKLPGH